MATVLGLFFGKDTKGIYKHNLSGEHPRKVYVEGTVHSTMLTFPDGLEVWVYWHESAGVRKDDALRLTREAWDRGQIVRR